MKLNYKNLQKKRNGKSSTRENENENSVCELLFMSVFSEPRVKLLF